MIPLLVMYISVGLLLCGLALPLIWRKIPPNRWYGFRVRRTLEDEAVWYAVNEFSAKRLLWVGIATVAAAVTLFFLTTNVDLYATAVATVVLVGLGVTLVQSFRYLRAFESDRKPAGQGNAHVAGTGCCGSGVRPLQFAVDAS